MPVPRNVSFELVDRSGRLSGVRLQQEIGLAGPLEFERKRGVWRLNVELPDVDRLEYLFDVRDANGAHMTIPDPANPVRAAGAFGEKSVLELAGYRAPTWLGDVPVESSEASLEVPVPSLDASVEVTVWSPGELAADAGAPLLVVHDGPEYARLGSLAQFLGAAIAARTLPPMRAALLGPGDRNDWYAANDAYAEAVHEAVLPAVGEVAPATARIGLGVSLGALAMLHLHRRQPGAFDGLFLQSGSFFTGEFDPQEADFSGFAAVTQFVASVHEAADDAHPVPTVLTCGTVEENLANNRAMADTLQRLGYGARLVLSRDAHNYTAWRDTLDPHLTGLITDVVGAHAA